MLEYCVINSVVTYVTPRVSFGFKNRFEKNIGNTRSLIAITHFIYWGRKTLWHERFEDKKRVRIYYKDNTPLEIQINIQVTTFVFLYTQCNIDARQTNLKYLSAQIGSTILYCYILLLNPLFLFLTFWFYDQDLVGGNCWV